MKKMILGACVVSLWAVSMCGAAQCYGKWMVKTYGGSVSDGSASSTVANLTTTYIKGESTGTVHLNACAGSFTISTYTFTGAPLYYMAQGTCQTQDVLRTQTYQLRVALMGLRRVNLSSGYEIRAYSNSAVDLLAIGNKGGYYHDRNTWGVPLESVSFTCH